MPITRATHSGLLEKNKLYWSEQHFHVAALQTSESH